MIREDLAIFFADFAVAVTVMKSSGDIQEIEGIFTKEDSVSPFDAESRHISLIVPSSANVQSPDSVEIDGITYKAINVKPLGDGKMSEIILQE